MNASKSYEYFCVALDGKVTSTHRCSGQYNAATTDPTVWSQIIVGVSFSTVFDLGGAQNRFVQASPFLIHSPQPFLQPISPAL